MILTLRTMTKLTLNSLVSMQDHILLLLTYLARDSRSRVKAVCLDDLRLLVARAAYLWTSDNVEVCIILLLCFMYDNELLSIIGIVY